MIITLFFAIPFNLNPARVNLYDLLKKKEVSNLFHTIITAVFLITSDAVAIFFPEAKKVFGILGGSAGTLIAFTLPALMYVKCSDQPINSGKNLTILIIALIVTASGFTGAITSVLNQSQPTSCEQYDPVTI